MLPVSKCPQQLFVWKKDLCFVNSDPNDAMAQPVNTSLIRGKYDNCVERCGEACEAADYSIAGMTSALECCKCHIIGELSSSDQPSLLKGVLIVSFEVARQ